ncbi:hypothetical protein F5Y09DRAFT_321207, partial [Xylaria sp. FL1042]
MSNASLILLKAVLKLLAGYCYQMIRGHIDHPNKGTTMHGSANPGDWVQGHCLRNSLRRMRASLANRACLAARTSLANRPSLNRKCEL